MANLYIIRWKILSNGRFGFAGYSQFRTGGSGAYEGNLLISDAAIERNLLEYIPVEEIYKLRDRLEQELSLRFGTIYNGYLGVDMMICRFPESPVSLRGNQLEDEYGSSSASYL